MARIRHESIKRKAEEIQVRQAALRNAVWRGVRDAGATGMLRADALQQLQHLGCRNVLDKVLLALAAEGFVRKLGYALPYVVDWDCRVPAGEEARLGPGWSAEPPSDSASPVATTQRSESSPAPAGTAGFRCAMFSDGTLYVCSNGKALSLPVGHTRAFFQYLDHVAETGVSALLPPTT